MQLSNTELRRVKELLKDQPLGKVVSARDTEGGSLDRVGGELGFSRK